MIVFAVVSLYCAPGGTVGIGTVSLGQEFAGKPWFITVLWLTGMLKLGGGVLGLALVQSCGQLLPRQLVLIAAWGVSILLIFHGFDFIIQRTLTENGMGFSAPAAWTTTHWQAFLWGPWWLLGGLAFCVVTWTYQRRSR